MFIVTNEYELGVWGTFSYTLTLEAKGVRVVMRLGSIAKFSLKLFVAK